MAEPTPSTPGPAAQPGPLLTYLKGIYRIGILRAALRGAQTAIAAAVFLLVGGCTFAILGKPAYLVALWVWNNLWNF